MAEPRILRGIFKDGPLVASAIIEPDGSARLMVNGAEPLMAGDPSFNDKLRKIAAECKGKLEGATKVELHAVLVRAALAEQVTFKPEDLGAMGLRRIVLLDADCGLALRVFDEDPAPVTLSYESL